MSEEFMMEEKKRKAQLAERLNRIGWGIFLIMLGIIWLVPDTMLPDGILAISIGVILIGLSILKRHYGIKGTDSNIFLGIVALSIGLGDYLNIGFPIIPVLLIFWGLSIIYRILHPGKNRE